MVPVSAHTPTPWNIQWEQRSSSRSAEPYLAGWIAFVPGAHGQPAPVASWIQVHGDDQQANAQLIARAVNAHDELVAALRGIMGYAYTGAAVRDVDPTEQPEFVAAITMLKKLEAV